MQVDQNEETVEEPELQLPQIDDLQVEAVGQEDALDAPDVPVIDVPDSDPDTPQPPSGEMARRISLPVALIIGVVALVVGLIIGAFALTNVAGPGTTATGMATVAEGDLDAIMATYSSETASGSVTVRDVIQQTTSLSAAQNEDGTYKVPSADSAMGVIRNIILLDIAKQQGITATDEEVDAYRTEKLGAQDYDSLAAAYSMDVDVVKALVRDSCTMEKLQAIIVDAESPTEPQAPPEPASDDEDDQDKPTTEYADYIIQLAGDEWDAEKDAWASTDGPYASALADAYDVSSKGAMYEAAQQAYYVAYQQYATATDQVSSQWNDYVNSIMSGVEVHLYTLAL